MREPAFEPYERPQDATLWRSILAHPLLSAALDERASRLDHDVTTATTSGTATGWRAHHQWIRFGAGGTNVVLRHEQLRVVLRISGPPVPGVERWLRADTAVSTAQTLYEHGAPVTAPLPGVPALEIAGHAVTAWNLADRLPSSPPATTEPQHSRDLQSADHIGAALAGFHAAGAAALTDSHTRLPALRDIADTTALAMRIDTLAKAGTLTAPEATVLLQATGGLESLFTSLGYRPYRPHTTHSWDDEHVVVHDDAWPQNILLVRPTADPTRFAARLTDFDNVGIGPRVHDLAFTARAVRNGELNAEQGDRIAAAYGQPLPSYELAEAWATSHRLRWTLDLAEQRTWMAVGQHNWSQEWPRWEQFVATTTAAAPSHER